MEALITIFLDWLDLQNEPITNDILSLVIAQAPGLNVILRHGSDPKPSIKDYLLRPEPSPNKVLGKILFVKTSIDFILSTHVDIDKFLDLQSSIKNMIIEGETHGRDMSFTQRFYDERHADYPLYVEFSENWQLFRDQYFKFVILERLWRIENAKLP